MFRRLVTRHVAAAATCADLRVHLPSIVVGLGLWVAFPTPVALQDMASLVAGNEGGGARWNAVVERSAAGSVHAAQMPFRDASATTGSIAGSGIAASGIGTVAFTAKTGRTDDIPDEMRVNRADKKGRVVKVAPVTPPKPFDAGSVFKRASLLTGPARAGQVRTAFVRPDIAGKEMQIAQAFYVRQEKKVSPGVPAYLAGLVTNDTPDILATAYAPPKPDYARASPFESLLRDEGPAAGRFVPPVAKGDHDWMKQPLPAGVFSKAEQTCLANAIYFEARGESMKGQAAVAQVVLNRVRNPTYPGTICGVVYQNQHLRNRCQFSFACDGVADRILSPSHYKVAEQIALAVTAGKIFIPEVASSTHYYAQYVSPGWARSMEKMKTIGLHIFYRTYGGGWS